MGQIYDYAVNYTKYLELRKERREQQQKQYDEQQKMIAENEAFIERFKGTYSKNASGAIACEDVRETGNSRGG